MFKFLFLLFFISTPGSKDTGGG